MKNKALWVVGLLLVATMLGATGKALYYKTGDAARSTVDIGQAVLVIRKDTAAAQSGVVDGDYTTLTVDATGKLHTSVGAIVPGVAATNLGKAEEGTPASGETGVMILTIRDDTPAATAADGKYAALLSNSAGELLVADDTLAGYVDGLEGGLGASADAVATQGGEGSVSAKLRLVTSQLNTIDADTGNIKTAIEGAEDELDGTTTTGPLDIIRAVKEGRATADSGQLLTSTAAATYTYTAVVVSGATYRVTAVNGILYLGIAAGSDNADILWAIPAGDTQVITIPSGTALYYYSDSALVYGRLSRIK